MEYWIQHYLRKTGLPPYSMRAPRDGFPHNGCVFHISGAHVHYVFAAAHNLENPEGFQFLANVSAWVTGAPLHCRGMAPWDAEPKLYEGA